MKTTTLYLNEKDTCLIDEADLHLIIGYKPYAKIVGNLRYVNLLPWAGMGRKEVFIHRRILNPAPGLVVDHINGDGFDNRRCNLRTCTHQENLWNSRKHTSGFKGVKKVSSTTWIAKITISGNAIEMGPFTDEVTAALAYDAAAVEHFGEFARLNFQSSLRPQITQVSTDPTPVNR